jgi:hypothetical protein
MSLGLEIMIMVSLLVFILTGMVSVGVTIWALKVYAPIIKLTTKQVQKMYSELDEEEAVKLERIK